MKTLIKITMMTILVSTGLFAENAFLNDKDPHLTKRELHSLKLARKWMRNGVKSIRGKDGSVTFMFGLTMPSVIAAPLRITDIRLEPGEKIREVQLGDTVRWQVSPSISGTAPYEVSHVIVKPTDVGLRTTLAIFTDRRTYNLNLKSTKSRYMPIVNFHYPEAINAKWAMYQNYMKKQQDAKQFQTTPGGVTQNIDTLDFNYQVRGNYSWKPLRVYNDGVHTYIQMPHSMNFKEAPVLMILDHGDQKLVNYRFKNDRFVVDKLFDKAVLIKGVGSDQEKIVIVHSRSGSNARMNEALRMLSGRGNDDF
jgi:type IV secretion system protein VirB9